VIEHDDVQSRVLEDLSEAVNYRRWLAALVRPYLGDDPIEIGAGIGDYAAEWLPTLPRLTVSEADDGRLKVLHERFVDDRRVTVRRLILPTAECGGHSAAVALNVLEHVQDDVAAMRSAARLLRPGGAVALVVPAFPSAMSRFDRRVGHFRRYTRDSLSAVLTGAGLVIEELRYLNPIGLLNWYLVCTLLGSSPRNGTLLRGYDRLIVPVARRLERRWRPPFGQSVFAVAHTPTPRCRHAEVAREQYSVEVRVENDDLAVAEVGGVQARAGRRVRGREAIGLFGLRIGARWQGGKVAP
jgi:ubiquinone/menaquinone biosynthesis C-methylase UbiE